MIDELTLENFKPFSYLQVAKLRPITLIYGPNSSGKSSIIQSLLLLKQTMEGQWTQYDGLIPRGEFVDLGSYVSLIHKHDANRELLMGLRYRSSLDAEERDIASLVLRGTNSRAIVAKYGSASSGASSRHDSSELKSVSYKIDDGKSLDFEIERIHVEKIEGDSEILIDPVLGTPSFGVTEDGSINSLIEYLSRFSRRPGRGNSIEAAPLSKTKAKKLFPLLKQMTLKVSRLLPDTIVFNNDETPAANKIFEDFGIHGLGRYLFHGMVSEYKRILLSISYLGPLRSHPARHYLVSGGEKKSVGTRGENTPGMLFRQQHGIIQRINKWFANFEIPYNISIKSLGDEVTGDIIAMQLIDRRNQTKVAPSDVGFGIGQLLPILVEGLVSDEKILCVEQPEIHLHPKLQAHIADFLIDTSGIKINKDPGDPTCRNQWIIETHSEALVLRLQKRIRKGVISAGDVCILYVEPGANGSRIRELRMSENGDFLDEWPNGFFEESFEEMFGD